MSSDDADPGFGGLDLEPYLRRIGLTGRPGIFELHRAHATSIPFENLDPQRGIPVSLQPRDLQRKLIEQRRGGYCFEQNLLLKAALEELGAEVEPILARVRMGRERGQRAPRTHLLLRVRVDGVSWHADVGFGAGTLWEPIPFGPGSVHEQAGWRFRVVVDGSEYVLQAAGSGGPWIDQYGFEPRPVPQIDIETSNWFTCSHPRSPFVTGFNVAVQRDDGRCLALSDWHELALVELTPAGRTETPVSREDVPRLLGERFELPGFALGDNGRIVRSG